MKLRNLFVGFAIFLFFSFLVSSSIVAAQDDEGGYATPSLPSQPTSGSINNDEGGYSSTSQSGQNLFSPIVNGVKSLFSGLGSGVASFSNTPANNEAQISKKAVQNALNDFRSEWDTNFGAQYNPKSTKPEDVALTQFVESHQGAFTFDQLNRIRTDWNLWEGADIKTQLEENLETAKVDTGWFGTSFMSGGSGKGGSWLNPLNWGDNFGKMFSGLKNNLNSFFYGFVVGLAIYLIYLIGNVIFWWVLHLRVWKRNPLVKFVKKFSFVSLIVTFGVVWIGIILLSYILPWIISPVIFICLIIYGIQLFFSIVRKKEEITPSNLLLFIGSFFIPTLFVRWFNAPAFISAIIQAVFIFGLSVFYSFFTGYTSDDEVAEAKEAGKKTGDDARVVGAYNAEQRKAIDKLKKLLEV